MQSRRDFLAESGRGVFGFCLLPLSARVQGNPSTESTKQVSPSALISDLERLIPKLMAETGVPGASIAIITDAKVHWRRGFGVKDRASKAPVDNDTVFEAASVSKTVFAYAAMKLCEKGIIGLDTPLTQYSPKPFMEGDPRLKLITARHVLSHTTGFQDWRSKAEPLKIHFMPGEKFLYSGEGYFYLQSVITELTGQVNPKDCAKFEGGLEVCATDIDAYLKANLLLPFGMASSGYVWDGVFEEHAARPHDPEGKPFAKVKPAATGAARYASAGGLHTTPTDYTKFLIELLDPKAADAFRLNKASHQEMLRPQVKLDSQAKIDDASSWALGWAIREKDNGNLIVHSGGQAGFKSLTVAAVGRKSGFIILTNGDNGWKIFHDEKFVEIMNRLLTS